MRNRIYAYAMEYQGDYNKIEHALKTNEPYHPCMMTESCITIVDPEYPSSLLQLEKPPWILFYEGNIQLLQTEMISIVGSRIYSEEGKYMSEQITRILQQKYTVVSGMAKGVDTIAHIYSHHTIGVVAHGLDICYPKENEELFQRMKQTQLLLSEYPLGVKPQKYYFPFRNRIIVALGKALVITSCKEKGGSMVSVNEALKLNRDVYTVPYSLSDPYAQGCNHLIEQGANIILTFDDVGKI
ncbi:MAG: DNA-processing protein DprA [Erysipelotrichaceae bacterium]|nr:DNA-processing protein DprA [Erysipelotrichaceae bacterium]